MKKVVYIFFLTKDTHTNKDDSGRKSAEKKCLSSYFIWLYERQNCPESELDYKKIWIQISNTDKKALDNYLFNFLELK